MDRKIFVLLIVLSFTHLVGCISRENIDQTQTNGLGLDPPCSSNEVIAVIQPDGNVYTYDICQNRLTQLTNDGHPFDGNWPQDNSYFFFDLTAAWSSDGNALLIGKGSTVYLIDLQNGTQTPLGDNVKSALWSSDNRKVAIVQTSINSQSNSDDLDYDVISIINTQDFMTELSFEGTAPVWVDDSELIYFFVTEKISGRDFLHDVIKVNLAGQREMLPPTASTTYTPIHYSRLSADKQYIAMYSDSPTNVGILNLSKQDTFKTEWIVNKRIGTFYATDTYSWSPTKPILAICTGGHGGTEILPPNALGAVLLEEFNQPSKILNDQRCNVSYSRVDWHPSGNIIAFLDTNSMLRFIDVNGRYMDGPEQPENFKIDRGPWWSPSGNYIGVISGNKVYIAEFNEEELLFEYITDGVEISWQPLQ